MWVFVEWGYVARFALHSVQRRMVLANVAELITEDKAQPSPSQVSWLQQEAKTSPDRAEKAIAEELLGRLECRAGRSLPER